MNKEWLERELMPKYGVAWWKCNEPSGNLIDSKGSNTGTVTGVARVDDGNGGYALDFNGTSSYVTFSSKVVPVGEKSIYFRFKRDGLPTGQYSEYFFGNLTVTASDYGIIMSVSPNGGHLTIHIGRASATNTVLSIGSGIGTNICDGKWHDVLFTWDGTTNENGVKLYIDDMNVPFSERTAHFTEINQPTNNLILGKQGTSNVNYFKGQLDNIQIYNKAIDPVSKFSLIKSDNKIYTLINNTLTYTLLGEPLTKGDFNTHGMTDLQPLIEVKTEKKKVVNYKEDLEGGKIYSVNVNRSEIPIIEKLKVEVK